MNFFRFENDNEVIIAEELFLHYLTGNKQTLLKNVPDAIYANELENLIELSNQFLEIAEKTFDFELAFEKFKKQNFGLQNMFKRLFRELTYYLENSDICGKCEERFLLESLSRTDDLVFYCHNCSIKVGSSDL